MLLPLPCQPITPSSCEIPASSADHNAAGCRYPAATTGNTAGKWKDVFFILEIARQFQDASPIGFGNVEIALCIKDRIPRSTQPFE